MAIDTPRHAAGARAWAAAGTRVPDHGANPARPTVIDVDATLVAGNSEKEVGVVGSSYDNALAETIDGLYKTELIKAQGPWRTVDQVEVATAEWVDWFNHRRLYEYCSDMPPVEMEVAHYAQQLTLTTVTVSD